MLGEDVSTEGVDLVVSELLNDGLLGEGFLSSLRDLAVRGFITSGTYFYCTHKLNLKTQTCRTLHTYSSPDTLILPSHARVWGQFVHCPDLPAHHQIPGP